MQTRRIAYAIVGIATALCLSAQSVAAEDSPPSDGQDKAVSGMSIVGNDEAPKALVIVPWKTSDLGDTLDVLRLVDDGRNPVDREVFRRTLDYYEIRTGNDR